MPGQLGSQGQGQGQNQGQSQAQGQSPSVPQMPSHPFHSSQNLHMMPPPSSIPPRPPTASSHRSQQSGQFSMGAPSPRPGTSGGSIPASSPRPPTNALPNVSTPGPVPIQPRPLGESPVPVTRPGTSMSMSAGMEPKTPSRPATASGFAHQMQQQQGQSGGFLNVNTAIAGPHAQGMKSPSGGFAPIAPAPNSPGSPTRGARRTAGDTPVFGQPSQPQQGQAQGQPQPQIPARPQTPRLSMSAMANVGGANGVGSPASLAGMGITGNVGPPNAAQNQMLSGMMSAGLLGGAGGGMMGPPVLPRSTSQTPMHHGDMSGMGAGMGMNGGASAGMVRQLSTGPIGLNPNFPGTPNGLAASPGQNGAVDPAVAARAMASLTNGMNMGLGAAGALGGMGALDMPIPQTPLQQQMRQPSQPPAASPFPNAASPGIPQSMSSMLAAPPSLSRMHSSTPDRKLPGDGAAPDDAATLPPSAGKPPANRAPTYTLPPLPSNVQMNPKVTRVSIVPLKDAAEKIPPLTEEEIENIKSWMKVDKEYDGYYRKMRERALKEIRETISTPRAWWEKDAVLEDGHPIRRRPDKFSLTGLNRHKEREFRERWKPGKREGFKPPRRLSLESAARPEQLVPIRLEFDVEHHKMRDTFVWNLNDPVITPEIFAQSVVEDYGLSQSYHAVITKAIQDQLSDFKAHSATFGEDGILHISSDHDEIQSGTLNEEEAEWWEAWRKKVHSGFFSKRTTSSSEAQSRKRRKLIKEEATERSAVSSVPTDVSLPVHEFESNEESLPEEMRILVKLDIIVGPWKLEDQFEWNLDNNDPTPEQFAEIYARDLGLVGEFTTAIAHSIREQVQIYQKSLFLVGHPSDGSAVQDDDLRMSLLPSLTTAARSMDQVGAFTPILSYLSDSDIERNEKEREKELNRRRRKTTRGRRGIALPDREPPKTFRTPAIGFPEVDRDTLAIANAVNAPTSRRAAAAAASLTIANMVASENGTVLLPTAQPTPLVPVTPVISKEKKPKGLFKAPSYPPNVLRPRAQLKGPTPSTAADISTLPPPLEGDLPLPSSSGAPDSKGARVVLTAKRVKELEREAKEKEYADGQHANMINGVWHCSNCGCPESIAVGRRKGPLGDKSQCGTCGKFWHRHRRPRPVEYNSNAEFHLNLMREAEQARVAAKRRRPPASAVDEPPQAPTDDNDMEADSSARSRPDVWVDIPPNSRSATTPRSGDRQPSPVSATSSASESPLASRVSRTNGIGHASSAPPDPPPQTSESTGQADAAAPPVASPPPPRPSVPPNSGSQPSVPQWLQDAMREMQNRYPDDLFEVFLRRQPTPEWRLKCLDCPGKLYTPGPGDTLLNYEVHLKNRQHRQRVAARVGGGSG
ncbi:SNF5-domain-containing protein [Wolfiporia cocos MD-104 SS10]|uniref:SNF5-domain-containing protein n=1 Tax=Wolfiporia cocos (strain MD-104) TaxID=742152 RepID=A0A2H3JFI3_WOLCO|nr:SNF5-domain-containing protein [Wolfiporia cocos MD-104 SS10]